MTRLFVFLFLLLSVPALHSAAPVQEVSISSEGRNLVEIDGRVFELIDDMYLEYATVAGKSVQPVGIEKWPDGVLPVQFSEGYTETDQDAFFEACRLWSDVSQVTCVRRSDEADYVLVVASDSNSSFVGRIGGEQELNLFNRQNRGIISHEIAHALGFAHQHNAPARDRFVTINWANIRSGRSHNFRRIPQAIVFGWYDYCSIMHYRLGAFSSNGANTIDVKGTPETDCVIGQRGAISIADAMGMADAYGRDPEDEIFVPVPDLADFSGSWLTNSGLVYQRFGVRTAITEGETRDQCVRLNICETICYSTRLASQSPAAGTPVDFGSTVNLETFVNTEFVFSNPPRGQICP